MAHNDCRTSSPSLSQRVRSFGALRGRFESASRTNLMDDIEAESDANDDSEHGLSSPERVRSDASTYSGDHVIDQVQSSRSTSERIRVVDKIAANVAAYPLPVLLSTWRQVEDLYREDAPFEARHACFGLATSIAQLPNVSEEFLQQLYADITLPVPVGLLEAQVGSLKALTRRGARTAPFTPGIGKFLTSTLNRGFELARDSRKRSRTLNGPDTEARSRERGLSSLFSLAANIEQKSPSAFQEEDQIALLKTLFSIAEKTSYTRDMKGVVAVLGPVIRASGIPVDLRSHCIELLCAISNAVEDVREDTKASIFVLLRSDSQEDVVRILLDLLSLALSDRHTSIVCGALSILLELIKNKGQHGLPLVTFGQFIEPFSKVHYGSRTTRSACLQTILDLLQDPTLRDGILSSDWTFMVDTILTATGDEIYRPGQNEPLSIESKTKSSRSRSVADLEPQKEQIKQKRLADSILDCLKLIASSLNSLWLLLDYKQKTLVARFYEELVNILPQQFLYQLIDSVLLLRGSKMPLNFTIPNLILPKDKNECRENYYKCFDELFALFMDNQRLPPGPYGRVMNGLREDLKETSEEQDLARLEKLLGFVHQLLVKFEDVQLGGWQKAVELAQTVAVAWKVLPPPDFEKELKLITPLIYAKSDEEDRQTMQPEDATNLYLASHGLAKVTLALVEVFLEYFPRSPYSSSLLFEKFMEITADRELSASIRLPALRLLARIRCEQGYGIFIKPMADSLGLAPYLRRTEDTRDQLAIFADEAPQINTPSRVSRESEATKELRRSRKSLETIKKPIPKPPLWMYPGGPGLPVEPPTWPSQNTRVLTSNNQGTFKMGDWLSNVIEILQKETDWEIYSYVVVHLPSQLTNPSLFTASVPAIKLLRSVVISQLLDNKFQEPPVDTHVKKGDVAFCLMQTVVILLGYADYFAQGEQDEMVKVFLHGIGTWDRLGQTCIQALAIACHTIPKSVAKTFGAILMKLERYVTHTNLTVDILEFLGGVARISQIRAGLIEDDYRKVFAICIKYLEFAREQRSRLSLNSVFSKDYNSSHAGGLSSGASQPIDTKEQEDRYKDLPQYVFVLAYHVITFWFLSTKLQERSKHVQWISSKLAWKDSEGTERMEEQSQVTLDMMLRTAYTNLGESKPTFKFSEEDEPVMKKTWLVGMSIVTVETSAKTGISHVIKRQISGTTYATFLQQTAPLSEHHIGMEGDENPGSTANVLPQHIFLQLASSIAPTPGPLEPVCLPEDALVTRAIAGFDRMDTVDGYRIGVVCALEGQSTERDILRNSDGSAAYNAFLKGLGTRVALKDASFNTQGLDRVSDQDGTHTYAWRDRLVEIVYHIPTLMPEYEHDPQFTNKKKHIGNNHVMIVWNQSGLPWSFDTFPGQFNSVHIVITPENSHSPSSVGSCDYSAPWHTTTDDNPDPRYIVQTITHPSFPRLSPCAMAKLIPLSRLAPLVRQMALNSAIFSNVWSNREDGEYVSSWRNRLREIVKLRERYAASGNTKQEGSGARGSRVYGRGDSFKGRVEMGGITEEDGIFTALDFSRWAGPAIEGREHSMPSQDGS